MNNLNFYLDNVLIDPPVNWQGIEPELNFEAESTKPKLSLGTLEFTLKNAEKINAYVKKGLSGGMGIFEGIPFRIEISSSNLIIFDGHLELTSADAEFEPDIVRVPVREQGAIDFLNDIADSFTFAYLAALPASAAGKINKSDYVAVPYVISTIPDYLMITVLIIAITQYILQLEDAIKTLAEDLAEFFGSLNTLIVSVGIDSLPFIGTLLKLLIEILVIISMYVIIIFMLIAIINNMIQFEMKNGKPQLKHKLGMKISTLFQRACAKLGYTFSSTILLNSAWKDAVIIPRKTALDTNPTLIENFVTNIFTKIGLQAQGVKATQSISSVGGTIARKNYNEAATGSTATGFFEGTFGDLIRAMNDVFNAKVTIIGNTLHYERVDYWANKATYTLPNTDEVGFSMFYPQPNGTNAAELASNYMVIYQLDETDRNTYDRYEGTSCQCIFEPGIISQQKNVLLKNLDERRLQFALAKRKEDLTFVEKVVNMIYTTFFSFGYNTISTLFNTFFGSINNLLQSSTFASNILPKIKIPTLPVAPQSPSDKRIGAMLLSSDFIGVPKILIGASAASVNGYAVNKLHANNQAITRAANLMNNFHSANFILNKIDTNGNAVNTHNQYITFRKKEIPFCASDFKKVNNNNVLKTSNQKEGYIDSLTFDIFNEKASIDFRIKEKFTNNIKQKYIIDGK